MEHTIQELLFIRSTSLIFIVSTTLVVDLTINAYMMMIF